jgi:hypothetical protein
MTPSQLSAIRARLDAATPGPWELWYGELDWVSVGIDGDTVAECRTHINHQFSGWQNLRNATLIAHAPTDLRALLDEVERLKSWQVAVADGLGYLNSAEGQGGYEVAEPETIIVAWREQEREVERLTNDLAMARQVSGELCEKCGWAMKFPGESCRCELVKWRDEWEAFKARMTQQDASSFRRGAEAMRDALLQRVSWGSDLADRIRAEPVPEDR